MSRSGNAADDGLWTCPLGGKQNAQFSVTPARRSATTPAQARLDLNILLATDPKLSGGLSTGPLPAGRALPGTLTSQLKL